MSDERFAPDGAIWVCAACGKTHKDQYGMDGAGSRGWDESCALNAVLCHDRKQRLRTLNPQICGTGRQRSSSRHQSTVIDRSLRFRWSMYGAGAPCM